MTPPFSTKVALPSLSRFDSLAFDALCALCVHFIYHKFEINPARFLATFVLLGVVPALPSLFLSVHYSVLVAVALSYALFYTTLTLSVILYRVSPSHPLAGYPGPLLLKVSKFVGLKISLRGKQHVYFKELHDKYGSYVRVGPNEISIVDVDAIQPVLGTDGMPKGPAVEGRLREGEVPGLFSIRDTHEHLRRRKLWNRAFTPSSVKDYELTLEKRALQLVEELGKRVSTKETGAVPVDLAKWLNFFTFDFMGDMAFGGGFELMREGDKLGLLALVEVATQNISMLHHVPWAAKLLFKIPAVKNRLARFREFAISRAVLRKKNGSVVKDLFHHLMDENGLEREPPPMKQVVGDATLAIVAGSDTTSTVMSGLFYFLLSHPEAHKRLRTEVDTVFPDGDPFDAGKLAEMPYMRAVINETLRLQPPVSTALQRAPVIGSGGKWVGNRFISESTAVFIPPYALHRDGRYFSPSPDSFWPERWLGNVKEEKAGNSTYTHVVTNTAAFIPFSFGPTNCVGKNLATLEMRMIVALLVQRFEMRFADGYDLREWEESLEDWYVMKNGKLPVVLTSRM